MSTILTPITCNASASHMLTDALLKRWEAYVDVAPSSRETYRKAVRQFMTYITKQEISQPTRETVIAWRDSLKDSLKATTIQSYLTALKLFFRWTAEEGIYPNVADHVKTPKISTGHKRDFLTSQQSHKVLSCIKTDTLKGKRDYAIIGLMLTTGVRTIEVTRANISDLRIVGDTPVLFVQGKGKTEKAEYVKLAPKVESAIREYINARETKSETEPLFASISHGNYGQRLTTRSIRAIAKKSMIEAGFNSDRLTAHSMRHTAGTLALLNGASPREVQQLLRHNNINTTLIYAHDLDRAMNDCELRVADAIFNAV